MFDEYKMAKMCGTISADSGTTLESQTYYVDCGGVRGITVGVSCQGSGVSDVTTDIYTEEYFTKF